MMLTMALFFVLGGSVATAQTHSLVNFEQDSRSDFVQLLIGLRQGSNQDSPGREGLTEITVRMLFRGTRTRTRRQFDYALASTGAKLEIQVEPDWTLIKVGALKENLGDLLTLLEEALTQPAMLDEELQLTKSNMINGLDLRYEHDEEDERHYLEPLLVGSLSRLPARSSGWYKSTLQLRQSIRSIQRLHLIRRQMELFRPSNLLISGWGNWNRRELNDWFEHRVLPELLVDPIKKAPSVGGRPPQGKPTSPQKNRASARAAPKTAETPPRIALLDRPADEIARIIVLQKLPASDDPDYPSIVFASSALQNRLPLNARSEIVKLAHYSYFRTQVRASSLEVAPMVGALLENQSEFAEKGISAAERSKTAHSLIHTTALALNTPEKRAHNHLTEAHLGLPDYFFQGVATHLPKLQESTVNPVIKKIFSVSTDSRAVLIIGPAAKIRIPLAAALKLPVEKIEVLRRD